MIFETSMFVGKDWKNGSVSSISITGKENEKAFEIATSYLMPDNRIVIKWDNNAYRYHSEVQNLIHAAREFLTKLAKIGIEEQKLSPLYELSVSSMNYLFLRGLSGKDTFPQSVNEELSMFLGALCTCITKNHSDLSKIRECVVRELEEGCYARSSRELCVKAKDYMLSHPEMELSKDEINIICNFYEDLQMSIEKDAERETE